MKTIQLFKFLPRMNNAIAIGLSFLLLISAIILSNTANIFVYCCCCKHFSVKKVDTSSQFPTVTSSLKQGRVNNETFQS